VYRTADKSLCHADWIAKEQAENQDAPPIVDPELAAPSPHAENASSPHVAPAAAVATAVVSTQLSVTLNPSRLHLLSTTSASGVISVQSCARLQLRVWMTRIEGVTQVEVEWRGRVQPAEHLHSAYSAPPVASNDSGSSSSSAAAAGRHPIRLLLLDRLGLLLLTDRLQGVLLFCFAFHEDAIQWTLCCRQPLSEAFSMAFHATSSRVLVVEAGKLHSLHLSCTDGCSRTAALGAPQLWPAAVPLHPFASLAVDNQRNLLAVTHPKDERVRVYTVGADGLLLSSTPLAELPYGGGRDGGVSFDPDSADCILAASGHLSVRLNKLLPSATSTLDGFEWATDVAIDNGHLTVVDFGREEIRVYGTVQ
jgi:hypothetical protein